MSGSAFFQRTREILIRAFCLGHVAVDRVGSAKLEMGECAQSEVHHDAAMLEKLLELGTAALPLRADR